MITPILLYGAEVTLNHLGLSDMWLSHDTFYSQAAFKNKIKSRLNDQYKQEWKSKIDESEKCLNFISQTSIRYNHVLHGIRATSKPNSKTREISREASLLQMASC